MDANNSDSGAAAKSSSLLSSFRGSSSYNHETETIFALPRMQLDFKSIHVQDPEEPSLSGKATAYSLLKTLTLYHHLGGKIMWLCLRDCKPKLCVCV